MEIVMSGDPSELSMNWRLIIKGINKEIFYLKVLVALYSNFNSEIFFWNLTARPDTWNITAMHDSVVLTYIIYQI